MTRGRVDTWTPWMEHRQVGTTHDMTAPGQEPDEIMTASPGGEDDAVESDSNDAGDSPGLGDIGDNHMPEDLRRKERGNDGPDDTEA